MSLDWWNPDKTEMAIDCIRMHCRGEHACLQDYPGVPEEGYYLAFSGGKDSVVVKKLADMAGVPYDAHFSLTTVDPKEVVQFVKKYHPDVERIKPQETMMDLIVRHHMPPTRRVRYCYEALKEQHGIGRVVLTGIRKQESSMRGKRKLVEHCLKGRGKTFVNPIIEWSTADVWRFIRDHKLPFCKLYKEGFDRIGCIGCPMGRKQRLMELERWPHVKAAYLRAFEKMLEHRRLSPSKTTKEYPVIWKTPEDVMTWWLSENKQLYDTNQMVFSAFE